jgi:hypothetical protein
MHNCTYLNAYVKSNDKTWENYTWINNDKKYRITLDYDNSFIIIFEDGNISERLNNEGSAKARKEAIEQYEKKEGGVNIQNSFLDGSVRQSA